jgi:4-amino-4-deoxy-L-arabinose transferase-like glycosyltransferase
MRFSFANLRRVTRWRLFVLPALVTLALALPHLGQGEFNVDTGWYSAVALQAWRDAASGHPGALWTLMGVGGLDSIPYFNKPPLAFWIHGLVLWALGPTLVAARLPSVLAAALAVVTSTAIARRLAGPRVALCAGLVLATTPEFIRHARAFSLDSWLALFMLVALWMILRGTPRATGKPGFPARKRPISPWAWYPAAGIPLGMALMTKPLVAILILPLVAAWLIVSARARLLPALLATLAVALAVALPWHLSMAALHNGAFTRQYVGHQIIDRAAGNLGDANIGATSPAYYLIHLAKAGWPWLITVALAFVALARSRRLSHRPGTASLALIWALGWLIALSLFADKRPRYLLPIYPAWAWLSAMWFVNIAPPRLARFRRAATRWAGPAAVAAGIVLAALPIQLSKPPNPQWEALFAHLRQNHITDVWQGAFSGARAARLYLEFGQWPHPTRDDAGNLLATPPVGAAIVYHARDGLRPGPNERTLFASGDLTLTRLESAPWTPAPAPDPGH